jgi:hypothetical protein
MKLRNLFRVSGDASSGRLLTTIIFLFLIFGAIPEYCIFIWDLHAHGNLGVAKAVRLAVIGAALNMLAGYLFWRFFAEPLRSRRKEELTRKK